MKYGYKILVCWHGANEYEELENVLEFSIIEELDALCKLARIKVAKLVKTPELIKIRIYLEDKEDYWHIYKVESVEILDKFSKEIICKSDINVPSRAQSFYEMSKGLGVSVDTTALVPSRELTSDALVSSSFINNAFLYNEINSKDELEEAINESGVSMFWQQNTLFFTGIFGADKTRFALNELNDILFLGHDSRVYYDFETKDFIALNKSTQNNDFISKITINPQNSSVDDSLKITVAIDNSPQPLSPLKPMLYTEKKDNGEIGDTTYVIFPSKALMKVFVSHIGFLDKIKVMIDGVDITSQMKRIDDYEVYEAVSYDNNDSLCVLAGYNKETGSNIQTINILYTEEMDAKYFYKYKTDILAFVLPPSNKQKEIDIKVWVDNQVVEFKHKYTAQGYYPANYTHNLNAITEFNVDSHGLDKIIRKLDFTRYKETKTLQIENKTMKLTLTPTQLKKELIL